MRFFVVALLCLSSFAAAKRYEIGKTGVSIDIPDQLQVEVSASPISLTAGRLEYGFSLVATTNFPFKTPQDAQRHAQFIYRNSGGDKITTQGLISLAGQQWAMMDWISYLTTVPSGPSQRSYYIVLPKTKSGRQAVSFWFTLTLNPRLKAQNEAWLSAMVYSIRVQ